MKCTKSSKNTITANTKQMANTKHTPGPWELHTPIEKIEFIKVKPSEDNATGWYAKRVWVEAGGLVLGEVCANTTDYFINDFHQFEANARLIAAAPELLSALWELRNYFGEHDKTVQEHKMFAIADAAIKKATE